MEDHQENHFHMDQDLVNATTTVASAESLDPASKTKLWLKIKIPNNNDKPTSADHEGSGAGAGAGSAADLAAASPKKLVPGDEGYRVCEYCGKKFTSGKAWGGHKRHHLKNDKNLKKAARKLELSKSRGSRENLKKSTESDLAKCNTIKAGDVIVTNGGQPTCCLCGKVFPSMNSLFGHMRFHPDRGWKGTQPPQTTSDKNSSSSSFSEAAATESEVEQIGLAAEEEALEADRVDLLNSLSSWSKTDKRGRTGFFDPIEEAAFILITLSHDTGFDKRKIDELLQCNKINSMDVKAKGKVEQDNVSDHNYSDWPIESGGGGKKRKELGEMLDHRSDETCGNINMTKRRKKKMMMSWIDKLNGSETNEGKASSFGPPGYCNIVKKMDSVDEAELMDYSHFMDVKGRNILPTTEVKEEKIELDGSIPWGFSSFQCDICYKTFPTGQALGGHKRCHWKGPVKAPSSDHIAASNSESSAEANQAAGETSQARHCILGIDLNLPYIIEDGD